MLDTSALLSPDRLRQRHRAATERAACFAADAQADLVSLAKALICLKQAAVELAAQGAPCAESCSAIDGNLRSAENHLATAARTAAGHEPL